MIDVNGIRAALDAYEAYPAALEDADDAEYEYAAAHRHHDLATDVPMLHESWDDALGRVLALHERMTGDDSGTLFTHQDFQGAPSHADGAVLTWIMALCSLGDDGGWT